MTKGRVSLAYAVISLVVVTSRGATHYVDLNSSNSTSPFLDWSTAATNIQDAVDASIDGDLVLVTNGVYTTGGRTTDGFSLTNRVVVDKAITVQSVNGPASTLILGFRPATTNGNNAIRGITLTTNAALIGFTVAGGATRATGDSVYEMSGGGIWCASNNVVISNCVVASNACANFGGGIYQGTLFSCTLYSNLSTFYGGGASSAILSNCVVTKNSAWFGGGGANSGLLYNCKISGNFGNNPNIGFHSNGGGVYQGTAVNCIITGNSAELGGGVYSGTISNSVLFGNSANANVGTSDGGGAYLSTVINSIVTGNDTIGLTGGGGLSGCNATNCVVYYNTSKSASFYNIRGGKPSYCCTFPMPSSGTGNITNDPVLASISHMSSNSPCRSTGTPTATSGTDIDGEAWANPPSIGCDEFYPGAVTGTPIVNILASYTNSPFGYSNYFAADISGRIYASTWDFGDGTSATNIPILSHTWASAGDYPVTLTAYNEDFPAGYSQTLMIHVYVPTNYFVVQSNKAPVAPFDTWAKAATNIQDAIDVAVPNSFVLVSNGVYNFGSRTNADGSTNRVTVWKPVNVQSVNGANATTLDGGHAMRCVYLTNGAALVGFTITNGVSAQGGGIFSASSNALVSSCLIISNTTSSFGGGTAFGTVTNCTFVGNANAAAYGGVLKNCFVGPRNSGVAAVYNCIVSNCIIGSNSAAGISACTVFNSLIISNSFGGASDSTLVNCSIIKNLRIDSAGAANCILTNCLVFGNVAWDGSGGGAGPLSTLVNCTVVSNFAQHGGSGMSFGKAYNCIVYYNNNNNGNFSGTVLSNCCVYPLPASGIGNFTNAPLLLDLAGGDYHLQPNSPCINAGNDTFSSAASDFDGNPRIQGGTVDVGAYEFQSPTSILSYAWAQQYGLPTDGSADFVDTDADGMNNWQEWVADSVPTNSTSFLQMLAPAFTNSAGVTVGWQSSSNRVYFLQRATDLSAMPAFAPLQSNIFGQAGMTFFLDTTATNAPNYFYRVGVQ